eukprot:227281_1
MAARAGSQKKQNGKQSTRDALSTFVPQTMKWILQEETNLKVPYRKPFPSVALFADISGFTNLTEKLSALPGTLGVETLADEINNYLTQIIKQIVGSGGDIFKFAGDALLCLWPPDKQELENSDNLMDAVNQNLPTKVLRAIRCALDIQKNLGEMSKCGVPELTLRVKLGIGVGIVDVLVVGGVFGRFENLPAGTAFFEAFNCENDCKPQQVIISQQCYEMVKQHIADCEEVGDIGNYMVKKIKFRIGKKRNVMGAKDVNLANCGKDDALFKKFSRYIPSAVVPHLRMPEQAWVGELRQVTIMFLSLPFNATDIKNIGSSGSKVLKDIHDSIRSLQTTIYKYQGSLNKFLVDDKGSTVMAVFGLPPVAHKNDAERAVMAALDLRKNFKVRYTKNLLGLLQGITANKTQAEYDRDKNKKLKKKKNGKKSAPKSKKKKNAIAIGITSGIVYLGLIGGAGSRREYSVLGDKVNLAARLMGLSKKDSALYGEIAVDESIKSKVKLKNLIDWKFIKTCKVKGKKQMVNVYQPIPLKYDIHLAVPPIAWLTDASDKSYITACSRMIEDMRKEQYGKCILVEGEAGLGKAALIRRVMDQTKNRIWWLWGQGSWIDETKESMKFPVWKQILLSFQVKYPFYKEKNRLRFEEYIHRRRPDLHQWLFLLSYFDLVSFVSPTEYDPTIHIEKEKKDLTAKKLRGTIWERNEKAVQELKDKIQIRMSDEIRKFEEEIAAETDAAVARKKKAKQEETWRKAAEQKVDKKIGNYVYDVVLCLLEWAGGKLRGSKPIAIVIDGLQWLRGWDWSLTRRLCMMLDNSILKFVALFISSAPMDGKRYTPHYISPHYVPQYKQLRDQENMSVIVPAAWGIQKTKKYIKSYFKHNHDINVRDVSPKLIETVHSQCGGRPGYCKEFLDVLKYKNDANLANKVPGILEFSDMRYKGEKKLSFSPEFEQHLSSQHQYSSIPIPPTVQAITARHLDVLNPESMLCLKTASTICISKGTRCLSFLKSTLKGSHPIKQFVEDEEKINKTLENLCKMKFIAKLPPKHDISHAIILDDNGDVQARKRTLPCQLYSQSSFVNHTQHGHLENHYTHHVVHHQHKPSDTSLKGRYGGALNNVVTRNKMNDSLTDLAQQAGFGGVGHMRSYSTVSQSQASEVAMDDDIKNTKTQSDENSTKLAENMPLTSSLVNKPLHQITWKKGMLFKSKGGVLDRQQERVFVFKGKTLYWFRNTNDDKYPLGRIKFDESILRLQLNKKKNETLIMVSRKKYVLRANALEDMKEWFTLFQTAMNSKKVNHQLAVDEPAINEEVSMDFEEPDDEPDFTANTGECYEFTHGFLRDAIYEQMLSTQRIRIHKKAQEYLRKVLQAISSLPDYQTKEQDMKDYTALLQRHQAIAQHYQQQQKDIGLMVAEDSKKKQKKKKHKFPGFIGLD